MRASELRGVVQHIAEDLHKGARFFPTPRGAPRSWDAWDAKLQAHAEEGAGLCAPEWSHLRQGFAGTLRLWPQQTLGGDLNVSAHLLDGLHYRGLLRVARRDGGTRVYEANAHAPQDESPEARLERADQLLDIAVRLYAPLPAASLRYVCGLLRQGVSHLTAEIQQLHEHAKSRYSHAQIAGTLTTRLLARAALVIIHKPDDLAATLQPPTGFKAALRTCGAAYERNDRRGGLRSPLRAARRQHTNRPSTQDPNRERQLDAPPTDGPAINCAGQEPD